MAARSVVEQAAESAEAAHREAASLKTQVAQQLKRIGELENRAFMMEIENKKLTRALQREVRGGVGNTPDSFCALCHQLASWSASCFSFPGWDQA